MQTQRIAQASWACALVSLVAWQLAPSDIEIGGQTDQAVSANGAADFRAARPRPNEEPPRAARAEAQMPNEAGAMASGISDDPRDRNGRESIGVNGAELGVYRRRLLKQILALDIPSPLAQYQLDSIRLSDDDLVQTYSRPLTETIALAAANGSIANFPVLQSHLESIGRDDVQVLLKYPR